MNKFLSKILHITFALLIPFLIMMTAIRLLISPMFPRIEYNMPGFPEDKYGLSKQERLIYAEKSIEYLINQEDISFLENLKMADGSQLYNNRELSHMVDVKNLVQAALMVWRIVFISFLLIIIVLAITKHQQIIRSLLFISGISTLGIIFLILAMVAINFSELFNYFHYLFFTGDTWLFYETDTLIRLFPLKFWQDAFIFVGLFALFIGTIFVFFCKQNIKIKENNQ